MGRPDLRLDNALTRLICAVRGRIVVYRMA